MAESRDHPIGLELVLVYLGLSGGYHALNGLVLWWTGNAVGPINLVFAALSVVLGLGLFWAVVALYADPGDERMLGASLLLVLVVLLDLLAVTIAQSVPAGVDLLGCLIAMGYLMHRRGSHGTGTEMDESDSVHDLGRDYP